MGQMLQENMGSKFEVCSIFKPDAPLAKVVEDVRKLSKDLTKQDHIVIVGGARNSLDKNQDCSIDKYLNFIAKRTSNTNVGFVNLLRRYDKPWMNGRVRSMNLRLDRALMRCDMSQINVTDTGTIVRKEYITHGLHLNSRGKMRLTHLLWKVYIHMVGMCRVGIVVFLLLPMLELLHFQTKIKST
jgi:hypothetical protein